MDKTTTGQTSVLDCTPRRQDIISLVILQQFSAFYFLSTVWQRAHSFCLPPSLRSRPKGGKTLLVSPLKSRCRSSRQTTVASTREKDLLNASTMGNISIPTCAFWDNQNQFALAHRSVPAASGEVPTVLLDCVSLSPLALVLCLWGVKTKASLHYCSYTRIPAGDTSLSCCSEERVWECIVFSAFVRLISALGKCQQKVEVSGRWGLQGAWVHRGEWEVEGGVLR